MKVISTNKEAYFEYQILETFTAGVALKGDEVKSIRKGQASLKDTFVTIQNGQAIIIGWNIAAYTHAYTKDNANTRRSRVLLLNRAEINQIMGAISRKGLTAIPLKLMFSDKNYVKIEIGLAKHKKLIDKRDDLKRKDIQREAQRDLKMRVK